MQHVTNNNHPPECTKKLTKSNELKIKDTSKIKESHEFHKTGTRSVSTQEHGPLHSSAPDTQRVNALQVRGVQE